MSSYLAYSYSARLTEKKQDEINKKVKKSQEEFLKGFQRGSQISLSIYFIYSLATAAAHASDLPADANKVVLVEAVNNKQVQPAPTDKPGFKPLSEGSKGAFIGGSNAICAAALQTGDFFLGLNCAFLLVIGGILINRPAN